MNFCVKLRFPSMRSVLYSEWMNEFTNNWIYDLFFFFCSIFNSSSYFSLRATRRNGQSRAQFCPEIGFIHRKNGKRGCPRLAVGLLGHLAGRRVRKTRELIIFHENRGFWAFSTIVTRLAIAALPEEEARTMAIFIFSPRKPSNLITKNSFFFIFIGICNINNEFEKNKTKECVSTTFHVVNYKNYTKKRFSVDLNGKWVQKASRRAKRPRLFVS